jgi:hypothetical protein
MSYRGRRTHRAVSCGVPVANIGSAVNSLAGFGAKNSPILAVPDLGKTPDAIAAGPPAGAASSELSAAFDLAPVNGSAAAWWPTPALTASAT